VTEKASIRDSTNKPNAVVPSEAGYGFEVYDGAGRWCGWAIDKKRANGVRHESRDYRSLTK
jgi:hypothetical protein